MKYLTKALVASLSFGSVASYGAPDDERYMDNHYFFPIGGWNRASIDQFRESALVQTNGEEPENIKLGTVEVVNWFMNHTQGSYYDYIYEPWYPDFGLGGGFADRGWEINRAMELSIDKNIRFGSSANGTPWGDTTDQSLDVLINYLEIADGPDGPGSYLQRDRTGNFRFSGTTQDPTIDEGVPAGEVNSGIPAQLEMQLTLSRNAEFVQEYWKRNLLQSMRIFQWYREQHPDLTVFVSGSSEVAQNIHMNIDFADYSRWSEQEFRDWLQGTGLYGDEAQFATIGDLNSQYGTSFPDFDSITPPTTVNWSNGSWWRKWHEFRINQVYELVQLQNTLAVEAGISPDRVYGHQQPGPLNDPGNDTYAKYAAPYSATFTHSSGDGITTYLEDASDRDLFEAMRESDPNWGIFEYNPIQLDNNGLRKATLEEAREALSAAWDYTCRILSPYLWDGGGPSSPIGVYTVVGAPFEQAIQEWIKEHENDDLTDGFDHQWHPESRDLVWEMNDENDVESTDFLEPVDYSGGRLSAVTRSEYSRISLLLTEDNPASLDSSKFHEFGFRMKYANRTNYGTGKLLWRTESGSVHYLDFEPLSGEHLYRFNLAHHPGWQHEKITEISIIPAGKGNVEFNLYWAALVASHSWTFDNPEEVYGASNFESWTVSNGYFQGVSSDAPGDSFFGLSTDRNDFLEDADRVVIDADRRKIVKVKINSSSAGFCELFWWHREDEFGDFNMQGNIPVIEGDQTLEIDLSNHPEWTGKITRLRIDPVNVANAEFEIDSILIVPDLLSPRPMVDEMILNTSSPYFEWDAPMDSAGEQVFYEVQVGEDFEFSTLIYTADELDSASHIADLQTFDGAAWWRVRSYTVSGRKSDWCHPMPIFIRPWTMDRSNDVRAAFDFQFSGTENGVWSGSGGLGTERVYFNNGSDRGARLNAEIYRQIRIDGFVSVDNPSVDATLFWTNAADKQFADRRTHSLRFQLPGRNETPVTIIDLSNLREWDGEISDFWIEPSIGFLQTLNLDRVELLPGEKPEDWAEGVWEYNSNFDKEGWISVEGTLLDAVDSGNFIIVPSGNGLLQQQSPRIRVNAATHPFISIRMKNMSSSTSARLFWTTDNEFLFDEQNQFTFAISSNDEEMQEYHLDLSQVPGWKGFVREVSIRPHLDVSGVVEIDRIALEVDESLTVTGSDSFFIY